MTDLRRFCDFYCDCKTIF